MSRVTPFETHHDDYDAWFVRHEAAWVSELLALRPFVPWEGSGLEIGVGGGRFAAPLGVQVGIDPSSAMLAHATARGVASVRGVAEQMPFADSCFDYALVVTTICFVDSVPAMLAETRRILRPQGGLVIGFIDRDSPLGQDYLAHQAESVFYRDASFFSADEVECHLLDAGFNVETWAQTLTHPLAETRDIEPLQPGRGQGAFVVVVASGA